MRLFSAVTVNDNKAKAAVYVFGGHGDMGIHPGEGGAASDLRKVPLGWVAVNQAG